MEIIRRFWKLESYLNSVASCLYCFMSIVQKDVFIGAVFLTLLLVFSLCNVPTVFAADATHQVRAGILPGNPLYLFDQLQDKIVLFSTRTPEKKALIELEQAQERLAEVTLAVGNRKSSAATTAAVEAETAYTNAIQDLASITSHNPDSLVRITGAAVRTTNLLQRSEEQVTHAVSLGYVDSALKDHIVSLHSHALRLADTIHDQEDRLVESEKISIPEAELVLKDAEMRTGVHDDLQTELPESVDSVSAEIDSLNAQSQQLRTQSLPEGAASVRVLVDMATLTLHRSQIAFDEGRYSDAYHSMMQARALTSDARKALNGASVTVPSPNELAQREQEESVRYLNSFNEAQETLKKTRSNDLDYLQKRVAEEQKVSEVTELLENRYVADRTTLLNEGKSEAEVSTILSDRITRELMQAHGARLVPLGFMATPSFRSAKAEHGIDKISSTSALDSQLTRGEVISGAAFVKNIPYPDPATGIVYVFSDDHYSYTSEAGIHYDVPYPEHYSPRGYGQGEVSQVYASPEGSTRTYSSTGYAIKEQDGSVMKVPYEAPSYEFVSGQGGDERVELTPISFEYHSKGGDSSSWDFDPVLKEYVNAKSGKAAIPITSVHLEETHATGDGSYTITREGETWSYTGNVRAWHSSAGKVHQIRTASSSPSEDTSGSESGSSGDTSSEGDSGDGSGDSGGDTGSSGTTSDSDGGTVSSGGSTSAKTGSSSRVGASISGNAVQESPIQDFFSTIQRWFSRTLARAN